MDIARQRPELRFVFLAWGNSLAEFQTRVHAENRRFYLMEANCRLNGYSYLNTMNGLNFPKAMYELLVEGCTSPLSYKQLSQPINFVYGLREKPIAP